MYLLPGSLYGAAYPETQPTENIRLQGSLGDRAYPGARLRESLRVAWAALQGRYGVGWPRIGQIAGLRVQILGGRIFERAVSVPATCRPSVCQSACQPAYPEAHDTFIEVPGSLDGGEPTLYLPYIDLKRSTARRRMAHSMFRREAQLAS
jgi:hypothetical protein